MNGSDVAHLRMRNLRLTGKRLPDPRSVVRELVAVQSQDHGPAKWSLSQRMGKVQESTLSKAFDSGEFLRTHVLRPTWHFVTPEDIVWMLELTGPRVLAATAARYRELGLDPPLLEKSRRLIARALRGSNFLTRKELRHVLERGGIEVRDTSMLAWIVADSELRALICSGPMNGKQHTYGLIEERAPDARSLDPDDALAELTLRFFRSHGPATIKDFRWWSSLKVGDIRRGLEMVASQLSCEVIEGAEYWFSGSLRYTPPKQTRAFLLQTYDEYTVAYSETKRVFDKAGSFRNAFLGRTIGSGVLLVDTQIAGSWKRSTSSGELRIDVLPWRKLRRTEQEAIRTEAARYARFQGSTGPDVHLLDPVQA